MAAFLFVDIVWDNLIAQKVIQILSTSYPQALNQLERYLMGFLYAFPLFHSAYYY